MSLYDYANGDPVNYFDPDGRGNDPNKLGEKFRHCLDLAQTISSLEAKIGAAITDFSNLRGYFTGANFANNLAGIEKAGFGGAALFSLAVGLVENAGATALTTLPAEGGSLPAVISPAGRLIAVGNPTFASTVQAAVAARNFGATVVGLKSIAPDAIMFAGEHVGLQRIFDPAGAYAEESLERGNALSQQQADTVKLMQGVLQNAKTQYNNDCGK